MAGEIVLLEYTGRVSTTGTVQIINVPSADVEFIQDSGVIDFHARIVGHDQVAKEGAAFHTYAAFRKDSGSWTEIITEVDDHIRQDWADPWSADITTDGSGGFNINVTSDGGTVKFACFVSLFCHNDGTL